MRAHPLALVRDIFVGPVPERQLHEIAHPSWLDRPDGHYGRGRGISVDSVRVSRGARAVMEQIRRELGAPGKDELIIFPAWLRRVDGEGRRPRVELMAGEHTIGILAGTSARLFDRWTFQMQRRGKYYLVDGVLWPEQGNYTVSADALAPADYASRIKTVVLLSVCILFAGFSAWGGTMVHGWPRWTLLSLTVLWTLLGCYVAALIIWIGAIVTKLSARPNKWRGLGHTDR